MASLFAALAVKSAVVPRWTEYPVTPTLSLDAVQLSATDPPVTCQILNLTLGPLTLNLLGLVVVIPSPIVINIFAIPGAGNLLGNLLCAVVNLLNGNPLASLLGNLAALQQLVSLLNQIVAVLGGL